MEMPEGSLSPNEIRQAMLQLRDGGLGLTDSQQTANAAYVASIRSSLEYLSSMDSTLNEQLQVPWLQGKYKDNMFNDRDVTQEWFDRLKEQLPTKSIIIQNFYTALVDILAKDNQFSIVDLLIKELKEKEFIRLQNRIQKPLRKF